MQAVTKSSRISPAVWNVLIPEVNKCSMLNLSFTFGSSTKLRASDKCLLKWWYAAQVLSKYIKSIISSSLSRITWSNSCWSVGGGSGRWPMVPSLFCIAKRKMRNKRKRRKNFKAETIKRLSLRSKWYCFSQSIESRIQKFFLSVNHGGWQHFPVFHGPSTLKSISPALILQWIYCVLCFSILNITGARDIIDVNNESSQSAAYKESNWKKKLVHPIEKNLRRNFVTW